MHDTLGPLMNSASAEWYTPPELVATIAAFLGGIDLDPCPARGLGGLAIPWRGRVFVNPPYGDDIGDWTEKGRTDPATTQIVLLVPARTDTRRWRPWWDYPICFVYGRLKFRNPEKGDATSAPFPSALLYRGYQSAEAFAAHFAQLGRVACGVRSFPSPYDAPTRA